MLLSGKCKFIGSRNFSEYLIVGRNGNKRLSS